MVPAGVQNVVRLEKATEPCAEILAGAPQARVGHRLYIPLESPKEEQSKENHAVQVTGRIRVVTRHVIAQVPQAGGPAGGMPICGASASS